MRGRIGHSLLCWRQNQRGGRPRRSRRGGSGKKRPRSCGGRGLEDGGRAACSPRGRWAGPGGWGVLGGLLKISSFGRHLRLGSSVRPTAPWELQRLRPGEAGRTGPAPSSAAPRDGGVGRGFPRPTGWGAGGSESLPPARTLHSSGGRPGPTPTWSPTQPRRLRSAPGWNAGLLPPRPLPHTHGSAVTAQRSAPKRGSLR